MSVMTLRVVTPPAEADSCRCSAPCSCLLPAAEGHSALSSNAAAQHLYTRETLASTLCLMGAKPRHSVKVAGRAFEVLAALSRRTTAGPGSSRAPPHRLPRLVVREVVFEGSAALLLRPQFEALMVWALAEYSYSKADQVEDLRLACRCARTCGAATCADQVGCPQGERAPCGSAAGALRDERHRQVDAGFTAGGAHGNLHSHLH